MDLALDNPAWRRTLRFTIGMTVGFTIAQMGGWTASYLMSVLLAMLLVTPGIDVKRGAGFLLVILAGGLVGLILTMTVIDYPITCLLVVTLCMFRTFYAANQGLSPLMVLMLILGTAIIPLLGLIESELSSGIVQSLLASGFFAVLVAWLMFTLIPEPPVASAGEDQPIDASPQTGSPLTNALISTAVMLPLIFLFYTFELTGALVVFIFAANMAQKPDLATGVQSSLGLVLANTMGGVIAIALYGMAQMVPSLFFIALMIAMTALQLSRRIFAGGPKAQLYQTTFTTVVLLLGNSLGDFSGDASEVFISRIVQITLAGFYIVTALYLLQNVLGTTRKRSATGSIQPETSLIPDPV